MTKSHVTIRMSDDALMCLDRICAEEILKAEKYNTRPKTKTDIVSDAILNYYSQYTEDLLGDPAMRKMQIVLQSTLLSILKPLIQQQSINHEDILVIKEYAKLISKGFDWNVPVEQIVVDDPSYDYAVRTAALQKSMTKNTEGDE